MIERTELLQRVINPAQNRWLLLAGAGFGKTVFLEQVRTALSESLMIVRGPIAGADLVSFVTELADAARRYGHADTSAAILGAEADAASVAQAIAAEPCHLAIDDVHQWDNEVGEFLIDLMDAAPATSFLVAGRGLPAPLALLQGDHRWQQLTSKDLAFTPTDSTDELAAHGLTDTDLALVVHDMSNGWPLALHTVANRIAGSPEPAQVAREVASSNVVVDRLLQGYLSELNESDLAAAGALALLPFFDTHLAESLGSPELLERLAAAGVPITFRSDGWAEIGERFRAALSRGDMPKIPASTIDYFVDRDEIHAAVSTCLSTGDREGAAAVIAQLDLAQETQLEPASLNAAMAVIGDGVVAAPRSLLVQAHVNATFGRAGEGLTFLERAVELSGGTEDIPQDETRLELLLELSMWRMLFGDDEASAALLQLCKPQVRADQAALRARILDLEALHSYAFGTGEAVERAITQFTDAIAIWREIGEPRPTAVSVFRLADVLDEVGRSAEALDVLDALPSAGPMTAINRARLSIERAALLPTAGRAAEVHDTLAEARRLAGVLGHNWLLGWAAATEIVAASFLDDKDTIESLIPLLEDDRYLVINDVMQAQVWCTASEALARCDMFESAERLLRRASGQSSAIDWFFRYHEASLAARSGKADEALASLHNLRREPDAERKKIWLIDLLAALCCWHNGDEAGKDRHYQSAIAEAVALDQPSLPRIAEHRLLERLQGAPSAAAMPAVDANRIEIQLFEGFRVTRDGEAVAIPAGNPSHLLKLVVLNGGRLVVDQAIDPLWPEVSMDTGRKRLRNILYRLRAEAGDVIERSLDSLKLVEGTSSDFATAVAAGRQARESGTTASELTNAIATLDRPLLPDDRYQEWAEEARASITSLLVDLYDRQAVLAEEDGDVDLAVHALMNAHGRDVFHSTRLARAKRLLTAAGRDAAAEALDSRSTRT